MSSQGRRLKRNPALIRNAIQRISKGHSLNSVAKAAGIPEAPLRRYNSKPEMIDRPIGPKTLLTDEEELGLATAALWLKERGLPLDALQLKCSAKELVEARGCSFKAKNGIPSDEWIQAFIERTSLKHGINLTLRTPNVLSRLRAAAGNEENITHYYQLLQQIVHDYHINLSSNIGNLDEMFIRFDLKSRKVIAARNAKSVYQLSSIVGEQLEHITVVAFVTTNGECFPPLFIFTGSAGIPRAIVKEFDGNAQVCVTPNGWIDDNSFVQAMRIFLHQLRVRRPFEQHGWFLLCLDGHGSHKQLEVAKLCHEYKVALLVLPPPTAVI